MNNITCAFEMEVAIYIVVILLTGPAFISYEWYIEYNLLSSMTHNNYSFYPDFFIFDMLDLCLKPNSGRRIFRNFLCSSYVNSNHIIRLNILIVKY